MADILLAAELENEMEAMAEGGDGDEDVYADDDDEVADDEDDDDDEDEDEDGDEDVYADDKDNEEVAGEEGQVDRSHLVGKPKRKRELKAGLLRSWIATSYLFFY